MGARVLVAGPGTMCRRELAGLPVERRHCLDEVIAEADAVMMLRIQRERLGAAVLPSAREYAAFYGLDLEHMQRARPEVLVMHPGPINRGVEIGAEVADGERSVILDQVNNGIAIRMAILFLVLGGQEGADDAG
jgi:aspartate carbamoyltransferase catalytic subunit